MTCERRGRGASGGGRSARPHHGFGSSSLRRDRGARRRDPWTVSGRGSLRCSGRTDALPVRRSLSAEGSITASADPPLRVRIVTSPPQAGPAVPAGVVPARRRVGLRGRVNARPEGDEARLTQGTGAGHWAIQPDGRCLIARAVAQADPELSDEVLAPERTAAREWQPSR